MELNKIHEGNAIITLKSIPDKSIDCCITSPPYFQLRDYENKEQIGNEEHFDIYIDNLIKVFNEINRILKDSGTCFINIGDTYGTQSGSMGSGLIEPKYKHNKSRDFKQPNINMHKCLCLIPERFAIEMIKNGWTLRNQIIWHKPNQMPSSAKDRFTVDFEKIFFFVKQPTGYYFKQQYEELSLSTLKDKRNSTGRHTSKNSKYKDEKLMPSWYRGKTFVNEEKGRNMRTVWSINTQPTKESHFATYPQKLVQRMLISGCPENGIVIDPFFGSGTTGIYARKSNRNFIGIELNPNYIKIAEQRLKNELGMFA
jgi:DNA modification methylase